MRAPTLRRSALTLALGAAFAVPACAATREDELVKMMEQLSHRLERMEKRNAELERRLQQAGGRAAPESGANIEKRLKTLEDQNARITQSLEKEDVSENEPELTARLKAVEYQSLGMLKQARMAEALEGITAGLSLTTVAQKPSSIQTPAGSDLAGRFNNSQLNYRGDVYVTVPLDNIGDTESRIFAQFRFGQGTGLNDFYSYSKPNASAFRVSGANPDDSVAILGQAWYQATIPLPYGGFKPHSKENLELTFGKMDPFVFFDQNAAANDETRQFLNTALVHNPLLDAGGDIGVDANGFSPGFRISYFNWKDKREPWRLSLGVFGSGQGANYSRFFSSPLIIAQAETQLRFFDGQLGNYRAYYWRNGQAPGYDGSAERRSGFGLSFDQRLGDAFTLFGRYGQHISGQGARFDKALTLGAEIAGFSWDRGGDSLGVGLGVLKTSSQFRQNSTTLDTDGNGLPDYGYAASGNETFAELYYRYRVNKQFEVSPDLQLISRPGGDGGAGLVKILGLRAQLTY